MMVEKESLQTETITVTADVTNMAGLVFRLTWTVHTEIYVYIQKNILPTNNLNKSCYVTIPGYHVIATIIVFIVILFIVTTKLIQLCLTFNLQKRDITELNGTKACKIFIYFDLLVIVLLLNLFLSLFPHLYPLY